MSEVLAQVPPDEIWRWWPRVVPSIADAIGHSSGEFTLGEVKRRLENEVWRLLILTEPGRLTAWACLGVVLNDDDSKTLWCYLAGGENAAHGVAAMQPAMQAMAVSEGCSRLACRGRRGWLRSGALPGWRHAADILEREI